MSTDPKVSTSTASGNSQTQAGDDLEAVFAEMESNEGEIATPIEQSTKFLAIIDVFTEKEPKWKNKDFLTSAQKQESNVANYNDTEKENIFKKLHACNLSKLLLLQHMLSSAWTFGNSRWSKLWGGKTAPTQEQQDIMDKIGDLVNARRKELNSMGIAAYQIANNGCHIDGWGSMSEKEQNLWIASAETMTVDEMKNKLPFVQGSYEQQWKDIIKKRDKDKLPEQKVGKETFLAEYKAQVLGKNSKMDNGLFLEQLIAKPDWNKCLKADKTSLNQLKSFLASNAFYADEKKTRQHFNKIKEEFVTLNTPSTSTSKVGKLVQYIIGDRYDKKWKNILESIIPLDPKTGNPIKKFDKETVERSQLPVEGDTIKLRSPTDNGATSSKYEVKGVQEMQAKKGIGTKRFFQVNLESSEAPVKGFASNYLGRFELGIFPVTLTVGKNDTFEVIFDPKKLNSVDKIENAMEQVKIDFNSKHLCNQLCTSLTTDFCTFVPGCKVQKGWNPFWEGQCVPSGQSIATKATESDQTAKMLTSQQLKYLDDVINTLIYQQTSTGFRMAAILQKMLD